MKSHLFILASLCYITSFSQNVGIGTTSPTNSLHVVPSGASDPVRIEGLNSYGGERSLLIIDPSQGVVKHMHLDSLVSLMRDSISPVSGTDNQNIDSIRLNGTVLTVYIENGLSAAIDLQPVVDSASTSTSTSPNIADGTYIPNVTNSHPGIDSVVADSTHYLRVGSSVQMSGSFNMYKNTSSNIIIDTIYLSLPVASNFTHETDVQGSINAYYLVYANTNSYSIMADIVGDRILIIHEYPNPSSPQIVRYMYSITYKVR